MVRDVDRAGTLDRDSRATNRTVWAAFALSLAFHAALLWVWKPDDVRPVTHESPQRGTKSAPLVLQLAPAPKTTERPTAALLSLPTPPVATAPPRRAPPPKAAPRPPTPPVITQAAPAPSAAPPPPAPSVAAAPPAPPELDFFALLEARRRARGEVAPTPPPPPVPPSTTLSLETERERHNREVAANLGLSRTPTYGPELTGGGVFQIQRLTADSAEFMFFGWNKDIRRNSRQRIEVARGDNPDIRIAIVRRMITIIRANESGDFTWVSRIQGRDVTLSARAQHNAELEAFLMEEFFAGARGRF